MDRLQYHAPIYYDNDIIYDDDGGILQAICRKGLGTRLGWVQGKLQAEEVGYTACIQ